MQGIQGITGIRGIGYRRRRGDGVTPGPSWPSAPVAGLHVYSEAGPAWCRQFSDGTGSVVADDPVGYLHNAGTLATPFSQATTGARPLMTWDEEKEAWYLQFDGVDDSLQAILSAYTLCDIWVVFYRPSGARAGVLGTKATGGPGTADGIYRTDDLSQVRSYEGGTPSLIGHDTVDEVVAYRKMGASDSPTHRVWSNLHTAPATSNPTLVSKDRIALGWWWLGVPGSPSDNYGDSRIYAIAATIGSVMSPEQVNALKADWSAKFGIEFAW